MFIQLVTFGVILVRRYKRQKECGDRITMCITSSWELPQVDGGNTHHEHVLMTLLEYSVMIEETSHPTFLISGPRGNV